MDGIISLEMTPDWQSPDVRTRLATCLTKASSLIIRMADSSSLFSGAVQYLEEIKRICQPFDDGERSADGAAELIPAERADGREEEAAGVQDIVAQEFPGVAVPLVGTGFGDE